MGADLRGIQLNCRKTFLLGQGDDHILEIDVGVKVQRQKSEPKNKNAKKITETGIETKTSVLFDAYSNIPVE